MIDINDIPGYKIEEQLRNYKGKNLYILKLKYSLIKKGKIKLSESQIKYIETNYNIEPDLINKIVEISDYLAESLKESEKLSILPKRILIQYILAENEKLYHIYGKLTKNQKESKLYFIPKTQVIDDPYFEEPNIEVDFEKYEKLDTKGRKLFQKQKEGVKFLLTRNGAILADGMGSGKTLQSVVAALESGAKKILIVCPSSAKINWHREINMLQEKDVAIINGSRWLNAKFTIINFDILSNFHTLKGKVEEGIPPNRELVNAKFDLCIIDEAHKVKNHKSDRGAIMKELCVQNKIERVWLLSGTPVANRPMDLYNLLNLIKSPLTNNWKFYVTRYCEGKQISIRTKGNKKPKKIWKTDGASNLEELNRKTKNVLLRRLTTEFTDMPEKTVIPKYFEMTSRQEAEYESLFEDYMIERLRLKQEGEVNKSLVELTLLRKYIAMITIPNTIELIEEIIETGEKVVVFTCFTEELKELQNYFGKKCVAHYGEMSTTEKQKSVDKFQKEGGPMIFIGNIISAGTAITLTQAHFTVFNSFNWVPGDIDQAEDRTWRIGQKNNVKIYYPLYKDTIVEKMWNLIKNKRKNINKIVGDGELDNEKLVDEIID